MKIRQSPSHLIPNRLGNHSFFFPKRCQLILDTSLTDCSSHQRSSPYSSYSFNPTNLPQNLIILIFALIFVTRSYWFIILLLTSVQLFHEKVNFVDCVGQNQYAARCVPSTSRRLWWSSTWRRRRRQRRRRERRRPPSRWMRPPAAVRTMRAATAKDFKYGAPAELRQGCQACVIRYRTNHAFRKLQGCWLKFIIFICLINFGKWISELVKISLP